MPPSSYRLVVGSNLDRALLVKFLHRTYQELCPHAGLAHLAETVEQYFSGTTPLWWIEYLDNGEPPPYTPGLLPRRSSQSIDNTVGCLWMGTAVDQCQGDRHSHIFILYVDPAHRRQGLGTWLMEQAETWARKQGDRQISLQVFVTNQAALNLYNALGYHPQSLGLVKPLQ